jgi:hypothetical protein
MSKSMRNRWRSFARVKKATGSFVIGSRVKASLEREFWDGPVLWSQKSLQDQAV